MKKFEHFKSNLRVLALAEKENLSNEFIIGGIIDKFFIQFELGWKVLKELLKNIRRINETFSMLYDITTLQSIGLNCMVKQAGSTLKSSSSSEIQETEKEYTS